MKNKLLLIVPFILFLLSASAQQKLKDGTTTGNNLPNKDAILELESANKGLLHVRVALKATTNPAPLSAHIAGMMVFNTATDGDVLPGIYYNDGTKWIKVSNGSGSVGPQGPAGKSITTGTGAPAAGSGSVGDSYIDSATGDIYTKGSDGTWTKSSSGSLKGADGATGPAGPAGAAGKSITSGTGAPAAGSGSVGDSYVDSSTGDIYTKGSDGNWNKSSSGSLKGADGAPGTPGPTGAAGKSITTGTGAPAAGSGSVGDSYIELFNCR